MVATREEIEEEAGTHIIPISVEKQDEEECDRLVAQMMAACKDTKSDTAIISKSEQKEVTDTCHKILGGKVHGPKEMDLSKHSQQKIAIDYYAIFRRLRRVKWLRRICFSLLLLALPTAAMSGLFHSNLELSMFFGAALLIFAIIHTITARYIAFNIGLFREISKDQDSEKTLMMVLRKYPGFIRILAKGNELYFLLPSPIRKDLEKKTRSKNNGKRA